MYVLRSVFGISYHEAWNVLPAWEVATLLEAHAADQRARDNGREVIGG